MRGRTLNRGPVPLQIEPSDTDQHVSVRFEVPAGKSTLRISIDDDFELGVESQLPPPGSASEGIRVLSESWTPERDRLSLEIAGVPGNTYQFNFSNARQIVSVEGAELDKGRSPETKASGSLSCR